MASAMACANLSCCLPNAGEPKFAKCLSAEQMVAANLDVLLVPLPLRGDCSLKTPSIQSDNGLCPHHPC
eukprot:10197511-Karenia_brevis.AAC.1